MTRDRGGATPVVGVVGWKNSGKTTLVVRLIEEFTRRGCVVASVKHAHHVTQLDKPGTDSDRHRAAGARRVAVISPTRWSVIEELEGRQEPDFKDVLAQLGPADLILVEGYKSHPIPKIEARRRAEATREAICDSDPTVIAIASDHPVVDHSREVFDLDAIGEIANFLELRLGPFAHSRLNMG